MDQAIAHVLGIMDVVDNLYAKALRTRLQAMPESELVGDLQVKIPSTDGTLRGAIVFALFHEGYHVGQMGYVRRALGKDRIAQL